MPLPMDKENLFNAPYFSSQTDHHHHQDAAIAALTRRFSRSASFQQPLYILKEKRGFSAGSPESTLGWPSSPPPFVKTDEDAWNLIYAAAAGQVARMKMKMNIATATATAGGVVAHKSNRGLVGAIAHPHCSQWGTSDGDEFFRHRQLYRNRGGNERCGTANVAGGGAGGCGARSPPSFPRSAWPPPQQHRQNPPKPLNIPAMKPTAVHGGSGSGCDGGGGGKRECAGTGVFLPRRYCNNPPESRKRQACSPTNQPARMIQSSSNKTFIPIIPPSDTQARINGGFIPHCEMLMGGQQRRSNHHIHGGVMESVVNNPEMLLPQEWTY